jgi:hypothetical protein
LQTRKGGKERKGKEREREGWLERTDNRFAVFGFVGCFLSIMAKVQNDVFFFFFIH